MDARFLGANIKMLQLFQHQGCPTSQLKCKVFMTLSIQGQEADPSLYYISAPWRITDFQVSRRGFPGGLAVMSLPAVQESQVQSLLQGRKDPLEKEMATHSSTLAWRIPWTEEPGGLQSMGMQIVGHD